MIHKLLVPTDGSPLSERALPLAIEIAAAQHAQVELVQVVQYPEESVGAERSTYQETIDDLDTRARTNLQSLAARAHSRGVPVEETLLHGEAREVLLGFETESRPDLVVMATHGRTGLAQFARGSVAETLLREGSAPVLLVRSFGAESRAFARAMVPLDGSTYAEEALSIVESLALNPIEKVHLCQAVDKDEARKEAVDYLQRIAARLQLSGLKVTVGAGVGRPSTVIAMESEGSDVVIMATRGQGGFDRLGQGTVLQYALQELPLPVLVVRVAQPLCGVIDEAGAAPFRMSW